MVFRVLQACKVVPVGGDVPGVGGPDFSCLRGKPREFMVEATSVLPERLIEKSNIPSRIAEDLEGANPLDCSPHRLTRPPQRSCASSGASPYRGIGPMAARYASLSEAHATSLDSALARCWSADERLIDLAAEKSKARAGGEDDGRFRYR